MTRRSSRNTSNLKVCNTCNGLKALGKFTKSRGRCKICTNALKRAKYAADPEERKKAVARAKKWLANNQRKGAAARNAWAKANPEKRKQTVTKYRNKNREECIKRTRISQAANPEAGRVQTRRSRERKLGMKPTWTLKDSVIFTTFWPAQCERCSSKDNLTIDHHYPLSTGNGLTLSNAVPLCLPCNSAKSSQMPEDFYTTAQLNTIEYKLAMITREEV